MAMSGTPDALTSGRVTAERILDGADHLVVLDPGTAFGDQLVLLARAIADCGLMDEFAVIGRNRTSSVRVRDAVQTLLSEGAVVDAGRYTISPAAADQLAHDIAEAAAEADRCRYPMCGAFAVDAGYCTHHLDGLDLVAGL